MSEQMKQINVYCEVCFELIAKVEPGQLHFPPMGYMFKSPDPEHGQPPPFEKSLGWEWFRCPWGQHRPMSDPGSFMTDGKAMYRIPSYEDAAKARHGIEPDYDLVAQLEAWIKELEAAKARHCIEPDYDLVAQLEAWIKELELELLKYVFEPLPAPVQEPESPELTDKGDDLNTVVSEQKVIDQAIQEAAQPPKTDLPPDMDGDKPAIRRAPLPEKNPLPVQGHPCRICGKPFDNPTSLKMHTTRVHKPGTERELE